jgi:hypothetical protein
LLKTAPAVQEIMGALLEDIAEGPLPDGDNDSALLEMMIGTVAPAARGAGEVDCLKATALVAGILADLAAATDRLPEPGERGGGGD